MKKMKERRFGKGVVLVVDAGMKMVEALVVDVAVVVGNDPDRPSMTRRQRR